MTEPALHRRRHGPFKPYFTEEEPRLPRAVSVQKCFRALDIDIIGTTSAT